MFITLLLFAIVLSSCAPDSTVIPTATIPQAFTIVQTPTDEAATPLPPTPIHPTVAPKISLPVDRFTALPDVLPLTSGNIAALEPVATYSEAQLLEVIVPEARDRAIVMYNSGMQVYDLPGLTSQPFLPFDLNGIGGRRTYKLSPTGKYLAIFTVEQQDRIQIWDLETQKKGCALDFPGEIDAGSRGPMRMEFFPESNLFLFNGRWVNKDGSGSNEIRLVNLTDCQVVWSSQPRLSNLFTVSPNGSHAVYLENDQAFIFNTKDQSTSTLGETVNIRGLGFTANSQSLIISYTYNTKIYNLASGEVTQQLESNQGKNTVYIYALEDGKRILIAGEKDNRVWDTTTNDSFSLGSEFIQAYRELFKERNNALITADSVWNLDKKSRVGLTKYPYSVRFSALSADASFLAVDPDLTPYQTDLWDTTLTRIILSLPDERAPIALGTGETFITSGDGKIFVRSFSNGELLNTLEGEYANGVALTGQQVLLWDASGNIAVLDVGTGQRLQQTSLPILPLDYGSIPDYYFHPHTLAIWEQALGENPFDWLIQAGRDTVVISPDHKTGIRQYGDVVQIFAVTGDHLFPTQENLLASYTFKGVWLRFKFSADGKQVAGITHAQLLIWDSQTGKLIKGFYDKDYLKGSPTNFGFSPDGSQVFLSSIRQDGRSLTIQDVKTGALVQSYEVPDCNLNIPYAVTAGGSQVWTITQDCQIGLFGLGDWQEIKSFGGPYSGATLALALSPDGKLLAVGYKQTLEVWDVDSGKMIQRINGLDTNIENFVGDFSLAFSSDGKLLAVRYGRWFMIGSTVVLFGVPATP